MEERLVPDPDVPGAFRVLFGPTAQSWVDPDDPNRLEFEYVQQLAELLKCTVLRRSPKQWLRIVHIGGAGMSLPRWVEWYRPGTAQTVCEPDSALVAEVRRKIPLPKHTRIKVREVDGFAGVQAMKDAWADALVLDAFAGSQVPGELVTSEFFENVARVLRPDGVFIGNVCDQHPFQWAKRAFAGVSAQFKHVLLGAEAAVWKGRRFGNLVFAASGSTLPSADIAKTAHRQVFGYQILSNKAVRNFLSNAEPFSEPEPSPEPQGKHFWFA